MGGFVFRWDLTVWDWLGYRGAIVVFEVIEKIEWMCWK